MAFQKDSNYTTPNPAINTASQTRFSYEPDDVAEGVARVINQDSDLMKLASTRGKQYANRRGLLNSSIGAQASQAAVLDAALPIASQQSAQTYQKNLRQLDIDASAAQQRNEILSRDRLMDKDVAGRMNIATLNVASHDRDRATGALTAMESVYASMFQSIAGNPDIPISERNSYTRHIGVLRDSSLALVEQMYGIDLDWADMGSVGA